MKLRTIVLPLLMIICECVSLTVSLTKEPSWKDLELTDLSMQAAVDSALLRNFGLISDSLEINIRSSYYVQARLPENPGIAVESEDLRLSGGGLEQGTRFIWEIEQSFNPFIRRRRINIAQYEINISKIEYNRTILRVIADAKTRYLKSVALQEILALSDSLVEAFRKVHVISVQQALAGKVSISDSLRTYAELAFSQAKRDRDRTNLRIANRELASIWGSNSINFRCDNRDIYRIIALPDTSVVLDILHDAIENQSQKAVLAGKKAKLELEKAARFPSIKAGGGVETVVGADELLPHASLSFSIPLLNWNQGNVKAAVIEVSQAEIRLREALFQTRKEVLNIYDTVSHLANSIETMHRRILPQLNAGLEASSVAYTSGKTNLLSLIDAQRSYFEASHIHVETCLEYLQILVELERITGLQIFPTNFSSRSIK